MTLCRRIIRLLAPICERERMEYRVQMAKVSAHAEDLTRTVRMSREQFMGAATKEKAKA